MTSERSRRIDKLGLPGDHVRSIWSALDILPFDQRTVLVLADVDGFTTEEIATALGRTIDEIRTWRAESIRAILTSAKDRQLLRSLRALFRIREPEVEVRAVVEQFRRLHPELMMHLKRHSEDLGQLRPDVFEHLVGECLAQRGFQDVTLVGRNAGTSADIRAVFHIPAISDVVPYFVEVKRWRDRVGISVINQVLGAMIAEEPKWGWRAAMVVSLAGFSEFRKTTKVDLGTRSIILKDKSDLLQWLSDYQPTKDGLWLPSR